MKMSNLNSRLARRAAATIALGLLLGAQTAMACTVANWNGGNSGNVTAGGPNSGGIARYSGICAMQTPDAATAWVEDNSPGGIDRIRARFYVLANNTSSADVYHGFAGDGTQLFRVLMRANGNVTFVSGGEILTVAGVSGAWNSIEIDWDAGSDQMTLIVNGGTPSTSPFTSPGGTLSRVQLGNLNAATGMLNFDAYESRRTTEIGRLCRGNPDADGTRDINDLQVLFTELQSLGGTPAPGTPDANEDGSVGLPDLNVIFGFIQSLQGDCTAFPG